MMNHWKNRLNTCLINTSHMHPSQGGGLCRKRFWWYIGRPARKGNSATLRAGGRRGPGGRARCQSIFLQGMESALYGLRRLPQKLKKDCIIQDDMKGLYSQIKAADGIVIGQPHLLVHGLGSDQAFHGPLVCPGGDDGYDWREKVRIVLAYAMPTLSPRGQSTRCAHLRRLQLHGAELVARSTAAPGRPGDQKNKPSWRRPDNSGGRSPAHRMAPAVLSQGAAQPMIAPC